MATGPLVAEAGEDFGLNGAEGFDGTEGFGFDGTEDFGFGRCLVARFRWALRWERAFSARSAQAGEQ